MSDGKLYTLVLFALLSSVGVSACAQNSTAISLYDLRVEHIRNPIQLDIRQPRLSWKIQSKELSARNYRQQTYRILVASTPELLASNQADLWDSGQVSSSQSVLIPYQGKRLRSRQVGYTLPPLCL